MSSGMKDDLSHGDQRSSGSTICAQGLRNLIHLLRRRVQEHGEKTVYTYLKDGESQETRLTSVNWNRGRSPLRHISNLTSLWEKESFCSIFRGPSFPRHSSGASVPAWSPCQPTPHIPTSSWQASSQRYRTQGQQSRSPRLPPWNSSGAK